MRRRNPTKAPINMTFWKRDGELWYADAKDLLEAIKVSGNSEEALKRKLGAGYIKLQEALSGARLTDWTVSHIEWGLTPATTSSVSLGDTSTLVPTAPRPTKC